MPPPARCGHDRLTVIRSIGLRFVAFDHNSGPPPGPWPPPTPDGLPPARRLIVLPASVQWRAYRSRRLLARRCFRTVSYAPSANRVPCTCATSPGPTVMPGYRPWATRSTSGPAPSGEPRPMPDHGLLVNVVSPGSNAATHRLKTGDVLLTYNGQVLPRKKDDLKSRLRGQRVDSTPDVWRDGRYSPRTNLAPGEGSAWYSIPRPAPEAIAEPDASAKVLVDGARSGDEGLCPPCRARDMKSRRSPSFSNRTTGPPGPCSGSAHGERARAGPPGRRGASWDGSVIIHLATHGVIDQGGSPPLGGHPDPDRLARPVSSKCCTETALRRPALGPRGPAWLGAQGRAGDALGMRDGPGSRVRR